MNFRSTAIIPLLLACAPASSTPADPADLLLVNGRIVTVDSAHPTAEAIAIKGDRIMALGTTAEMDKLKGPSTRRIDLQGKLAIPGFIEGHGHFLGLGSARMHLNLSAVENWDNVIAMVGASARDIADGAWISGRGWHQEKWNKPPVPAVEDMPTHASLDSVSPNNPVFLSHASGHAAFVNGAALRLAGITRATKNPPGGEIVRGPDGEATGVLRETAQGLVYRKLAEWEESRGPEAEEAEARRMVALAAEDALAKGVTSFQDMGESFASIDLLKRMAERHELPVRLYVMVGGESLDAYKAKLASYRMIGVGNNFLTVRGIKLYADGALGSHGAWMLKPYSDMPSTVGLPTTPPARIEAIASVALADSFQVATHAIGDRANREILNIYERLQGGRTDLRWRVEHAQHIDPADIPRFGKLGVIASMQAVHATSDGPWVPKRIGDQRARDGAYVWHSLLTSGAIVLNGTDVPVEDVNPIASYYASVSRKLPDGSVFYPGQRMTREEALRAYTLSNAYAAFEEDLKGSLTVGKLADITVLSRDILTVAEDSLPGTKVLYTIVGGKVAYQAAP
ncbi:MAG TPA: amidohydrolase [Gemmatimonadales bacterium]|nr:amidohydrolase [Gemmatimonadales bacterium]